MCIYVYMMVSSFADDGPSFFTLLHCRRIPAGFRGIIGEKFPRVIYLKVLSGPWFKVVVYEDDKGKMAMQEGMKDFMLANEISIENFLLFRCDGNLSFHVQIFNPSGLERVPENQEQLEAIGTPNGKRKRGRPRKCGKKDHMLQGKNEKGHQDSEKEGSKKIPAFFKAFVTQDAQRRLNIPLAFTGYINGNKSFTASLRDRRSYVWTIKTTKSRNQYSFDDGWPEFVEDNDVRLGDFLVFQFDGKCTFDFKHFGSSMCEKKAKFSKFKVKEEYEGLDKETKTAEKEYADPYKFYGDVHDETDDNEEDECDIVVVLEDENDVDKGFKMKESGNDEGDYDYNNEKEDNYDDDNDVAVVEEKNVDEEVFKKLFVNDDGCNEEDAIFESGIVVRPKNPYFVAKIYPSHRNYLSVPSDVIRRFNLKLPEYLFLFAKHERGWKTKVNVWKDGRTWLSEGWRPFCKYHSVQLDDRCICKFVPSNGGRDIYLEISIVRAGSW